MLLPVALPSTALSSHSADVIMLPCTVTLYGAHGGQVHGSPEQTEQCHCQRASFERLCDPGHCLLVFVFCYLAFYSR